MVPDIAVLFSLDGRSLRLDYRKVPLFVWDELKTHTGCTPKTLLDAVQVFDVKALVAIVWLERKVRERKLSFGEVYQSLSNDTDFELDDILIGGRSLIGGDDDETVEVADDEDPPTGSS